MFGRCVGGVWEVLGFSYADGHGGRWGFLIGFSSPDGYAAPLKIGRCSGGVREVFGRCSGGVREVPSCASPRGHLPTNLHSKSPTRAPPPALPRLALYSTIVEEGWGTLHPRPVLRALYRGPVPRRGRGPVRKCFTQAPFTQPSPPDASPAPTVNKPFLADCRGFKEILFRHRRGGPGAQASGEGDK